MERATLPNGKFEKLKSLGKILIASLKDSREKPKGVKDLDKEPIPDFSYRFSLYDIHIMVKYVLYSDCEDTGVGYLRVSRMVKDERGQEKELPLEMWGNKEPSNQFVVKFDQNCGKSVDGVGKEIFKCFGIPVPIGFEVENPKGDDNVFDRIFWKILPVRLVEAKIEIPLN